MKRIRHWYQSIRAHVRLRTIAIILIAGILAAVAVPPAPPGWWAGRHATNTNEKDDYAPLNQGQLKNLAMAAFDEMEEKLAGTGGAGGDFTKLIKRWHVLDGNPPTPDNPLSTFRLDAAGHRIPQVTPKTDDYSAVNVGQLKAVAMLVYDRFEDAGFVNGYPWDNSAFAPDDYAVANIGQAKNLFAFDLVTHTFSAYHSPGGDGIAYQWKIRHGLNPNSPNLANEIAPGGITYLQKYNHGLDPTKADSDDDGNIDGDELKGGANPKDPASTLGRAAVEVALFSTVTKAEVSFGAGAGLGTFHEAPTTPINDTGGTNFSVDDPVNPGQTIVIPDGLDEEKLGQYNSLVVLPTIRPKPEDETEGAAWIPNWVDETEELVDVNGNTFRRGHWSGTYHSLTEDKAQGVRVETGVTVSNVRIASMPSPPLPSANARPYAGALIASGEYTFTDLEHGDLGQGTPTTSTAFTPAVRSAWLTIDTASLDEAKRRLYGLPILPWGINHFLLPPPYTATTSAGGEYGNQVAFWIQTDNGKPAGADITRSYLKVTKDIPSSQNPTPVPTTQSIQLTIPKGKTSSTSESVIAPNGKTVTLLPLEIGMIVDANGDHSLNDGDNGLITATNPWNFWINDDDDLHESGPSLQRDCLTPYVDGKNDLEDFFPVFLDIQRVVKLFPPGDDVKYILKQEDSAVNFLETGLRKDQLIPNPDEGQEWPEVFGTGFNQSYESAETKQVTSGGVELSPSFLTRVRADSNFGVILVEGRAPTSEPLTLCVFKGGEKLVEEKLPVKIGPRVLLLLHGMNSKTATWDEFVKKVVARKIFNPPIDWYAKDIFTENKKYVGAMPKMFGKGVYCFRLQFGGYDLVPPLRAGLERIFANNIDGSDTYAKTITIRCGDFETFEQLGREIDDAIEILIARMRIEYDKPTDEKYPDRNLKVVLLGHSRGGIAARMFLQMNSARSKNVVGMLTTGTPHLGSRMGRIYSRLDPNRVNPNNPDDLAAYYKDWQVQRFLQSSIDVRRPVIGDLADDSVAIRRLNLPGNVRKLPKKIKYGEMVYEKVAMGHLIPIYNVFGPNLLPEFILHTLSSQSTAVLLSGQLPEFYPGDGLVSGPNQHYTKLPGFPKGSAIGAFENTNDRVYHTNEPSRTDELSATLHQLISDWFP